MWSQVRVCKTRWCQVVIKACSGDKELTSYPLNSNIWLITTGLLLGRAGFKRYNVYFRSDFPWEPLVSCRPLAFLVFQGDLLASSKALFGGAIVSKTTQSGPQRLRHIIIKLPKVKDKERILKAVRGKQIITCKGVPIRLTADFSKESWQARNDWQEVFKVMKSKDLQPGLPYTAKI